MIKVGDTFEVINPEYGGYGSIVVVYNVYGDRHGGEVADVIVVYDTRKDQNTEIYFDGLPGSSLRNTTVWKQLDSL
jgi:hypothetical protein